jgi:hypothetical protein
MQDLSVLTIKKKTRNAGGTKYFWGVHLTKVMYIVNVCINGNNKNICKCGNQIIYGDHKINGHISNHPTIAPNTTTATTWILATSFKRSTTVMALKR